MYNSERIVSTRNLEMALDNDLHIDVVPHTPAVSPRGWANCSTLVTNEAVSDDVITRDIVMSFNTQDTQGRDVDVRTLIEEYADTYSVDPEKLHGCRYTGLLKTVSSFIRQKNIPLVFWLASCA